MALDLGLWAVDLTRLLGSPDIGEKLGFNLESSQFRVLVQFLKLRIYHFN